MSNDSGCESSTEASIDEVEVEEEAKQDIEASVTLTTSNPQKFLKSSSLKDFVALSLWSRERLTHLTEDTEKRMKDFDYELYFKKSVFGTLLHWSCIQVLLFDSSNYLPSFLLFILYFLSFVTNWFADPTKIVVSLSALSNAFSLASYDWIDYTNSERYKLIFGVLNVLLIGYSYRIYFSSAASRVQLPMLLFIGYSLLSKPFQIGTDPDFIPFTFIQYLICSSLLFSSCPSDDIIYFLMVWHVIRVLGVSTSWRRGFCDTKCQDLIVEDIVLGVCLLVWSLFYTIYVSSKVKNDEEPNTQSEELERSSHDDTGHQIWSKRIAEDDSICKYVSAVCCLMISATGALVFLYMDQAWHMTYDNLGVILIVLGFVVLVLIWGFSKSTPILRTKDQRFFVRIASFMTVSFALNFLDVPGDFGAYELWDIWSNTSNPINQTQSETSPRTEEAYSITVGVFVLLELMVWALTLKKPFSFVDARIYNILLILASHITARDRSSMNYKVNFVLVTALLTDIRTYGLVFCQHHRLDGILHMIATGVAFSEATNISIQLHLLVSICPVMVGENYLKRSFRWKASNAYSIINQRVGDAISSA